MIQDHKTAPPDDQNKVPLKLPTVLEEKSQTVKKIISIFPVIRWICKGLFCGFFLEKRTFTLCVDPKS